METAPFRADLAEAPDRVVALWRTAPDGVRLRIVAWPLDGASGTVFIFPGRTEYAEKYGRIARYLQGHGFSVATIDWRGQGFSDRLLDDRAKGHVLEFRDYQQDVGELVSACDALGLAEPRHLIAHSMGGAIGLRALLEGLPVRRSVFSAPMWGINVPTHKRALAMVLPTIARRLGRHLEYVPGTGPANYSAETDFRSNLLTQDFDHFTYLGRMAAEETGFALGGPTLHWFDEAVREGRNLLALPRPTVPSLTCVGSEEAIVSVPAIRKMHADWSHGRLEGIDGARHELMMEAPTFRSRFLDLATGFLCDTDRA